MLGSDIDFTSVRCFESDPRPYCHSPFPDKKDGGSRTE